MFALFDEGGRQINIGPEIASKVKVSWMPRLNQDKVQQGILPDIKVPSSATDSKYVQLSLSDGSGLEFGFTIRSAREGQDEFCSRGQSAISWMFAVTLLFASHQLCFHQI